MMQRDHPIESLKLISTHFTIYDWRIIVRMSMHFERKTTHNSERIRRQKVDRSHRLQLLRPSEVLRLPLSLIFDGEHCYPYNGQKVSDVYNWHTYGIRELFSTSSFGFGLGVHNSSVFWIASSLNEHIRTRTRVEIAQGYLDIDKVFEKLSLSQKICIAFDGIRDLVGYEILRDKKDAKELAFALSISCLLIWSWPSAAFRFLVFSFLSAVASFFASAESVGCVCRVQA